MSRHAAADEADDAGLLEAGTGAATPAEGMSAGRIAGAASLLSIGNVLSRILGLVRTQTIAHFFGTSLQADAFNFASKAPQTIYDLLVGGQLHGAIVPVLSDYHSRQRDAFWRAASVLFTVAATVSAAAAVAVLLSADLLAPTLIDGATLGAEALQLTAGNLRWMAASILLFGMAGISTGILYVVGRYHYAALAMPIYNLAMIGGFFLLKPVLGYWALAFSVTLGGLAQVLTLGWGLRDSGLRPAWDLGHPALRRSMVLYGPVALGLLVTQLQILASVRLASMSGTGVGSMLNYADRLIQFPQGIIASSVAVAILPALAAAHAEGQQRTYQRSLARGLRLVICLVMPAAVGMAVLAGPIIGLAFQSGQFGDASRLGVTLALWAYLLGLPLAAIDLSLVNAFYARQNTRAPALVGALSVVVYLVAAYLLGPGLHLLGRSDQRLILGLALADSVKHAAHVAMMLWLLYRIGEADSLVGVAGGAWRSGLAALTMGLAVAGLDAVLAGWGGLAVGKLAWGLRALAGTALGAAVYFPLAAFLGVPEIRWAGELLLGRLRRS